MKEKNSNWKYLSYIFVAWLITYIFCQIIFIQRLGWDEVSYLSVAKGIADDFDFSSRAYTVMGLLKHGYPTNLINFPIFSSYLAVFLKLFGMSLKVAYFSTWLAALGVCILLYFIFKMLSSGNDKLSLIVSISYLLFPGNIKNCDTALMEQVGCFLLCLSVYVILRNFQNRKINYLFAIEISLLFLVLWLYKSLFVGFFFGMFIFILLMYKMLEKDKTKPPIVTFLGISYGLFIILYFIAKKFLFLPVAPMMNFTPSLEARQLYSDFLAGFFDNFPNSLLVNISYIFGYIIHSYFIYPIKGSFGNELLNSSAVFVLVGLYFFVFMILIILTFAFWKELKPIQKLFIVLTLGTIISFNLIFNFLFSTTIGNIWRYNSYSLPLYLCYAFLIFNYLGKHLESFISSHKVASKLILSLFIIFLYIPLSLSMVLQANEYEVMYHNVAKGNASIVKSFIKDTSPSFIYYNDGNHITWDLYPMKQVFKDATNEQLLQINKILPEPIGFLFLKPTDWLFKNNENLIFQGKPILDGIYVPYGIDPNAKIVVYRYKG